MADDAGGEALSIGMAGMMAYQLIEARDALKTEINAPNGMIISRAVCAKTIIPWLYSVGITEVLPPYSKRRKIKAFNDVNAFMVKNGFPDKTL